jgi:glycosyltransferase involved in cell wall biosynthesis
MRIAIYHPWIYLKSGLERTIMELCRRSRHDWTVVTSHYDREGTYPEFRDLNVTELERVSVTRRYGTVLAAAMTIARSRIDLVGHDALVVCCDGLGSFINFRNHGVPVVCLCFTPLRAVYDEAYKERHLSRYQGARPVLRAIASGYRLLDRLAWRYYRHVFCVSETVKQRVLDGGLCAAERIEIAHPGVASEAIEPSDCFEPFFFLPGRIMWTKNIELGIRAFQAFRKRVPGAFELVVAGMVDEKSKPYLQELCALAGEDPSIRFVTDLSDAAMSELYRRCHAVLFTAFNEDLGLTPLEAGMHGKPVVAVNRGGPTETVRDGVSGYLVEPDPAAFSAAMERLAVDPGEAKRLGRQGVDQSRQFTWDLFVEKIDGYFDGAGGPSSATRHGASARGTTVPPETNPLPGRKDSTCKS